MFISVRGCSDNNAGGCRQLYELSMMSQVSNGLLKNQVVLLILGLLLVLVIGGEIFPAVWSRKKQR